MQQWEYFRKRSVSDSELTNLGNDGWELVGITATAGNGIEYVFKRPKNVQYSNNSISQQKQSTPVKEYSMEDLFPGIQIKR